MSILNKVFDFVKANDFDDEDYADSEFAFEEQYEEPVQKHVEKHEKQYSPIISKTENEKILSMSAKKDYEIVHFFPDSRGDAPSIAKAFKEGKLCIISASKLSEADAQTVADFIAGASYALNGVIKPIADDIFIAIPSTISYKGDLDNIAKYTNNGFFR